MPEWSAEQLRSQLNFIQAGANALGGALVDLAVAYVEASAQPPREAYDEVVKIIEDSLKSVYAAGGTSIEAEAAAVRGILRVFDTGFKPIIRERLGLGKPDAEPE